MLRLTVASLLAHRLRLLLTAAAIAIGAALVAGTFILTDSARGALSTSPATAPGAAVIVQPAGAAGGKGAGPVTSLPASLAARISAVRGAASAEGLVTASKITLIGKNGRPVTHRRAPSELLSYPAVPALAAPYTIQSGHPPRQPGQALLDAATARGLGYRIGDRISVVTPVGPQSLTVTGITGFGGADSPAGAQIASFDTPTVLVVQTATAQRLTGLPGRFTEIDVLAAPGVSAAALRSRLAPLLPPRTQALTGEQAAVQQTAAAAGYLRNLQKYLLAFCAVALLVAAFVIASTFSILTAQRAREYALLRIIGASRGQVLRSSLGEAGILGLTASAAGTGLGAAAAAGLRGLIALLGGTLPAGGLAFAPRTAVIAIATGTAVTVASALRPARRAARVRPIRALREAAPAAVGQPRGRLITATTATAAAIALMVTGSLTQSSRSTALAAAGALAAAAALLAAGPLLARPTAHLIAAPAAYRRGPVRRANITVLLARDNAARNPRRTAALAGILTIGLATATAVSIIAASARASAQDAISAASHADLYLRGNITPALARAVTSQPEVAATMRIDDPLVQVAGAQARIDGIDPATAAALVNFGVRTGSLATLRGNAVFVSALQAARHGWHTGSPITINFGQAPPSTLRVAGTFTDKRFLGDDYLMPIQTLFRDMPGQLSDASMLLIRTAPGARAGSIRAAITTLLSRYPQVTLLTPAQYRTARAADLGDISHVLAMFTALVALTEILAALGIASALTLSVTERNREFAVLRALGLTRHQLAAMIRAESMITTLLGALPGAAIGAAAGIAVAATLTRDQTGVTTIGVSPAELTAALILTCLAALLAGTLPARHAGRIHALRALGEQQ
jgi:putative ABC transport system permease protein